MKKTEDFRESPLPLSGNDENKSPSERQLFENSSKRLLISAASKDIATFAPRKKILAERNGVSSGFPYSNSAKKPTTSLDSVEVGCGSAGSNLTHNSLFRVSPVSSSSSKISKSDHGDGKGENRFGPYDPLTNLLSPRPRFLRYNPNRHRQILLTREKFNDLNLCNLNGCVDTECQSDAEQGESTGSASVSSNSSSPDEDLSMLENIGDIEENEVTEKDEEEIEEEEVRNYWSLKWVLLKFLLVLIVLVLSTAYISTMNSPTPPPAIQAVRGIRNECQRVGGGMLKVLSQMKNFTGGGGWFFHGRERYRSLFEMNDINAVLYMELVEEEVVRNRYGGGEQKNAQQLDEVELDERRSEGDSHGEPEENRREMAYDVTVLGHNFQILEEFDRDDGLENEEIVEQPVTHQNFDECCFLEEEVETEVDDVNEMTEKSGIILEALGSSANEEPGRDGSNNEFFEKKDFTQNGVDHESENVSGSYIIAEQKRSEPVRNWKDQLPFGYRKDPWFTTTSSTTKDTIWVAVVAVGASLVLGFYFRCKRTSAKTRSSFNARLFTTETDSIPNKIILEKISSAHSHPTAEAAVPKRTPCRLSTPPRPRKSIAPDVKLIGEVEFGDHTRGVKSVNPGPSLQHSVRSENLAMDSAASYGSFNAEKKIVQEEDWKQGEPKQTLSSTPVRRSMRIRNRGVKSP